MLFRSKRRTLQRSDIASALSKSDMFDFLIDIVPREEAQPHKRGGAQSNAAVQSSASVVGSGTMQGGVPQHQMAHADYMGDHLAQQAEFRQGMYAPPSQNDAGVYGQVFDPTVYGGYNLAQPSVSFVLVFSSARGEQ